MSSAFRVSLAARAAAPRAFARSSAPARLRRAIADVPPASPGGPKASNSPYFFGAGALALAGAGYYFFATDASPEEQGKKVATAVKTAGAVVEAKTGMKRDQKDYQEVYNYIAELLDADDYDDGSYGPVLVRLAWHSSGTYDKNSNTGGSNYATMRFEPEAKHGANNGLNIAREVMEKVKQKFPWISYGDLWTLGGVAAIQEMQGPHIPWRPGRIDGSEKDVTPDGRLPDASLAQDHLRQIFYRMGFNDEEIVALSGAHALGRCHTDRSGFEGPWTFSPTTFTNDYFKLLLDEKWSWRKWNGPKQYEDVKTKSLMMLPTDMALVKDKSFNKSVKLYAEDQDKFFDDFAKAFSRLMELGVPTAQFPGSPWTMKTLDEQEDSK